MSQCPEDESMVLCMLAHCERHVQECPSISVLSSISLRIMIGIGKP